MTGIIGAVNVGYEIIDGERYNNHHGYVIGHNREYHEYVVWWFAQGDRDTMPNFYYGAYFPYKKDDLSAQLKAARAAKANFYERLAEEYKMMVRSKNNG